MSNKDWSTMQTAPKLGKVHLTSSIKLVISEEIMEKIQYLCKNIAKVEWSGLLFYTVEGTISKSKTTRLICQDIFLMDKGTQAYTEYDWDEDIIEYRMNNPEALEWKVGHVHSHNTMSVFFSGTDMDELNDNCPNHNIYLSLIVNNFMEMTAKVAFTAQPTSFVCKDENGADYSLKLTSSSLSPLMFTYDCEIDKPEVLITINQNFANRLKEVEEKSQAKADKAKEERDTISMKNNASNNQVYTKKFIDNKPNQSTKWDAFKEQTSLDTYRKNNDNKNKSYQGKNKERLSEDWDWPLETKDDDSDDFTVSLIEEEFTCFVLRLGNVIKDDEVENALEDAEIANISPESIVSSILESYTAYYEQFFDKIKGYDTAKEFLDTLVYVTERVEECEQDYSNIVPVIVEGLRQFGNKIEQQQLSSL